MASSGYVDNAFCPGVTLRLSWAVNSQSIADNTSNLTVTAQLISTGYSITSSGTKYGTVTINGTAYDFSFNASLSKNATKTICTKTVDVAHNSDGSKSVPLAVSAAIKVTLNGTYYSTVSTSTTAALDPIARVSSITLSEQYVTLNGTDGAVTVTIGYQSSAFTHRITAALGSYTASYDTPAGRVNQGIPIPMEVLNQIKSATRGTMTITLTTYNGTTAIGSKSATLYVDVGSTIVPTISSVTATRIDGVVPSTWGVYVQGLSKCKLDAVAAGAYSSTITRYAITGGMTAAGASVTSDYLYTPGTVSYTVTVTDSRGRTASKSVSINVCAYDRPQIKSYDVHRCNADGTDNDSGAYLSVNATWTISSCDGHNSATGTVKCKLHSADTWTTVGTITSGTTAVLAASLGDDMYDVSIIITDPIYTSQTLDTLDAGITITEYDPATHTLNLLAGLSFDGVAFGDRVDAMIDAKVPIQAGTWTPILSNLNGNDCTYTSTWMDAIYYKIGDLVYVTMSWKGKISSLNGGNYATVRGLPFAAAPGVSMAITVQEATYACNDPIPSAYVSSGTSYIRVQTQSGSGATVWKTSTSDQWFFASGVYRAQ